MPLAHQGGDKPGDHRRGEGGAGPARPAGPVGAPIGKRADVGADDPVGRVGIILCSIAVDGIVAGPYFPAEGGNAFALGKVGFIRFWDLRCLLARGYRW